MVKVSDDDFQKYLQGGGQRHPVTGRKRPARKTRGVMNRLEERFEKEVLIPGQHEGRYIEWAFEAIRVLYSRPAEGQDGWYTPDFVVRLGAEGGYNPMGPMTMLVEVKGTKKDGTGLWLGDSRTRLRAAAGLNAGLFRFSVWTLKDGTWQEEHL